MDNVLLIWDIDGTLLSCGGAGSQALDETFHALFKIPSAFEGIQMAGKLDKNIIEEALSTHKIKDFDMHDIINHYGDYLQKILMRSKNFKILQNVKKNLHNLSKDNRIYNVIATGNSEVGSLLKLRRGDLEQYFKVGSFGNHYNERFELVKNAVITARYHYNIDFKEDNIFMIGDTPDDIHAGQVNNIKTIAVATGGYSYETLKSLKPDYIFEVLPDNLIDIILNGGEQR